MQHDTLSSFLSSSLNVELVYILLMSITTFSKRSAYSNPKNFFSIETAEGQDCTVKAIDFNAPLEIFNNSVRVQKNIRRTLTLNQIQIKNID